jgi:hypothetical protein
VITISYGKSIFVQTDVSQGTIQICVNGMIDNIDEPGFVGNSWLDKFEVVYLMLSCLEPLFSAYLQTVVLIPGKVFWPSK